jgi:RNase adapter protein RapZ
VTDILAITGLSGAGRSQVADDLEDLGWFVVDNVPSSLIEKVVELGSATGSSIDKLALVVGPGSDRGDFMDVVNRLRAQGHTVRVLFLDAADTELVRRYGSTRRKHPLDAAGGSVLDAIRRERELLEPLKEEADLVIDTTSLNVHQLKTIVGDRFGGDTRSAHMQTAIVSFGYKHGIPLDVDLVFDCRFLPNPFWVERLRDQSGLDAEVRSFVEDLLDMLLPAYTDEGKSYLTIAVGCTGGRHRSVAIAEELGRRLRDRGVALRLSHRDLNR